MKIGKRLLWSLLMAAALALGVTFVGAIPANAVPDYPNTICEREPSLLLAPDICRAPAARVKEMMHRAREGIGPRTSPFAFG